MAPLLALVMTLATNDPAAAPPADPTSTSTSALASTSTTSTPTSTPTSEPTPAAPAPSGDEALTSVVVLDLRAEGVDPALASAVSSVVGAELFDLGVLRVTTEEDVRRMMDFEQLKLVLACQDKAKCLTSFQEALGGELLVTGTVGKVGSDTVVGLVLSDVKRGVAIGRETANVASATSLVSDVRVALGRLFLPVLRARGGTLVVLGNEVGATVLLDGAAIGVTPLRKDGVAAGPHRVEAVKDGFVKGVVDVTVKPTQTAAVDVVLVPSPEFSAQHKDSNNLLRTVALGVGGAGLVSLSSGAALWWLQDDKINNKTTGYANTYPRDATSALVLPSDRYNEVNTMRVASYVLMGATVPLLAGAGIVWFVSDDPNKYDALMTDAAAADPAPPTQP